MHRRKLLGAVGLGATGVAGLLGDTSADGPGQDTETDTTTTTTGTTTTAGEESTGIDSAAERPFARIAVGSREGVRNPENNRPHLVRVWNDSEQARIVEVALGRATDAGRPLLDRQIEFPADGYLSLRLLEPGGYRLRVGTGGNPTTIRVPRTRFDCNDSRTDVTVTPDGEVESTTIVTEEACPPEVVARSFTAFAGSCGSANRASVAFAEESVAVRGSIQAPNPCYGAALADVSVADGDTLRVTVTTTEPEAAFCAQCIAHVEYRTDLGFRDRVPETVEVVHRSGDESRTVARATRGAGGTTRADETTRTDGTTRTDRTRTGEPTTGQPTETSS